MEVVAAVEENRSDGSRDEGRADCSNKDQNSEAVTPQERLLECDRFSWSSLIRVHFQQKGHWKSD